MTTLQQSGPQRWVARYLNLQPGEGLKVVHFALVGLLFQLGLGIGFSAGDALFLANVGSKGLALIFILTPFIMMVYTPIFSWIVSRFGMQRACNWTAFSLAVGGAAIFAIIVIAGVKTPVLFYAVKLYLAALYITVYSMYWLYVDDYFSVQEGKRLYPLLSVGCSLGTAGGALIVSMLASVIEVGTFFIIWAGIALITIPVARAVPRLWRTIADLNARTDEDDADNPQALRSVVASMMGSRFTKYLAAMMFVTLLITNIAEYQYSAILERGRSEAELASVLGMLYGVYHGFNILVGLFAFSPLVKRFGVKNVALLLPVVYLATFVLLFLSSSFLAAAVAFWAYHSVLTSIEYNNQNLLFNALPAKTRRGVRTLIEGLCEPFASCFAGVFLLLLQEQWGLRQIAGVTLLVAALLVAISFGVRSAYPEALSRNMRLGWLNFGASRRLSIDSNDDKTVTLLAAEAAGDASPQTRDALQALIDCAPKTAAPILVNAMGAWSSVWSDRLEVLLKRFMSVCDEALFAQMLRNLLILDAQGSLVAQRQIARLRLALPDANPDESLVGHVLRLRGNLRQRADGLYALDTLLCGGRDDKMAALGIVQLLGNTAEVATVASLLDDADPAVASEALRVLAGLVECGDAKVIALISQRLAQLGKRDRRFALDIFERAATAQDIALLLRSGDNLDPDEFRRLEAMIVGQGPSAVPALVVTATDGGERFKTRRLAIRALASISLKHLEAWSDGIVDSEMERVKEMTRRRKLLQGVPAASLLARLYADRQQESLDIMLEVLALVGQLPDVDLISASLKSASAKVRADALETLNTSLSFGVYRSIVEVIEGDRNAEGHPARANDDAELLELIKLATASGDTAEAEFARYARHEMSSAASDAPLDAADGNRAALTNILRLLGGNGGVGDLSTLRFGTLLRLAALIDPANTDPAAIRAAVARLASQEPDLAFGLLRDAA